MTRRVDRILVVDDEPTNRMLLKGALEKRGYAVELATNGEEALEKLARSPFDLVLADLEMPGLSGLDVIERVKDDGRLRHIPIIVISATQELEGVVRCIEAGAHDYLPKPFDPVLLDARVRSSLAAKRLHDVLDVRVYEDPTSPSAGTEGAPLDGELPPGAFGVVDDAYGHDIGDERTVPSSRANAVPAESPSVTRPATQRPPSKDSHRDGRWDRFTLLPGVELHVRDSNAVPSAPDKRKAWLDTLLERLRAQLEALEP